MTAPSTSEITQLLADWGHGERQALDQLMPLVYAELHKLAAGYLRGERRDHTLQPTALIHEAYLRLAGQRLPEWQNRAHFFGVAARLMRQILVDHARARAAEKRGGEQERIPLEDAPQMAAESQTAGLLALDESLTRLALFDERKCRIIEMRSFGGMSVEETALALGISAPTVKREMRLAQAWLRRELEIGV